MASYQSICFDSSSDIEESETSVRIRFLRVPSVWLFVIFWDILNCLWIHQPCPHPPPSPKRGHAAADNIQTYMPGKHGWYTQAIKIKITWLTPRATSTKSITQCLFLAIVNKTKIVGSWAWRDQQLIRLGQSWPPVYMNSGPKWCIVNGNVLCCRH